MFYITFSALAVQYLALPMDQTRKLLKGTRVARMVSQFSE